MGIREKCSSKLTFRPLIKFASDTHSRLSVSNTRNRSTTRMPIVLRYLISNETGSSLLAETHTWCTNRHLKLILFKKQSCGDID